MLACSPPEGCHNPRLRHNKIVTPRMAQPALHRSAEKGGKQALELAHSEMQLTKDHVVYSRHEHQFLLYFFETDCFF